MAVRRSDIIIVALVALMASLSAVPSASWAFLMLTGLLLVFYLPGYAIMRAAFLKPRTGFAGAIFAVGLSLVATTFCGFALHYANALTPVGWLIALGGVTVVACGIAWLRDSRGVSRRNKPMEYPRLRFGQAAMLVVAAVIVAGTIMLARHQVIDKQEFAYTELWMLSRDKSSNDVTIGISNVERSDSLYDLELILDGRTIAVRGPVHLRVGQSWTLDISLPVIAGSEGRFEARLFKDGDNQRVYRRVWLQAGTAG